MYRFYITNTLRPLTTILIFNLQIVYWRIVIWWQARFPLLHENLHISIHHNSLTRGIILKLLWGKWESTNHVHATLTLTATATTPRRKSPWWMAGHDDVQKPGITIKRISERIPVVSQSTGLGDTSKCPLHHHRQS